VGHIQVPTLGAGASTTVTGEVFADALTPGTHTLWVLADGHDIVAESFENNNGASVAVTVGPPPAATPPGQATVTFDDLAGLGQPLDGQYPTEVIDWGTNTWYLSRPWGAFTTKSVSFTQGATSRTFTFVTPRRLQSVRVYNGGGTSTTVNLSCAGQTTKTQEVAAGQVATVTTGWTGTCTIVTLSSTNGWDTNFDDLVHADS
jgi:hypothetical protein